MADATFKKILDDVREKIVVLRLSGAPKDEVKVDYDINEQMHFDKRITVHPVGEQFDHGGTCCRDDIGYRIQVTMIYPNSGDVERALTRMTDWRERIRKKFHNQRLANITSVWKCEVSPAGKIDREFVRDQHEAHALTIVAWSREARDC